MYISGFNVDEKYIQELICAKIADNALMSMGYDAKRELEYKVKLQIEQLDTAEISKQATAFLIAKVMGEIK